MVMGLEPARRLRAMQVESSSQKEFHAAFDLSVLRRREGSATGAR